jgi:hypothetical protein
MSHPATLAAYVEGAARRAGTSDVSRRNDQSEPRGPETRSA